MKQVIAMLIIVLIVTMPLAAAQSEYTEGGYRRLISSGGGLVSGNDNYVGEPVNIYVDHYEPTVLTTNLIEQDDVPVFVFLRGNTLGSFLGLQGNLGEPLYGTPEIRDINPRIVGGSKYVRSIQYVPPRQMRMDFGNRYYGGGVSRIASDLAAVPGVMWDATVRGYDSALRGVAHETDYRYTDDLDNLGMLVVRLARIPKEADVPDAIELNISANVYFNTERSLSFQRWEMELEEQPDPRKWLGDRRPLLGEEGFGRYNLNWIVNQIRGTDLGGGGATGIDAEIHKGNTFFYGQGYLRAEDVKAGEATIVVYDGYLNEIGKSTLKIGEESVYYSLRGTYGDRNDRIKFKLNDVFDPRKKRVDVDIVVGNKIQRVKLFERSRLYPGSSWVVNSIDVDGRRVRVELVNDFGNEFTLTADLAKPLSEEEEKKKVKVVGEDPCLNMDSVSVTEFGKATEKDTVKLYCSAIVELKKIIRNYGNVPTEGMTPIENEKNYADVARWKISEAYLQIAKLLDKEGKEDDARKVYEVAREEARYINDPALLNDIETKIIESNLFGQQGIDSRAAGIDDLGERISIQIREVWGESIRGIPAIVNGKRVSLTDGGEIGTSGYVVTESNDDTVWLSTEKVKVYEWEKKFGADYLDVTETASAKYPKLIASEKAHSDRQGERRQPIKYIVLHMTEGSRKDSTIAMFKSEPRTNEDPVSAHYIVDTTGTIYQMVDEDKVANHAGEGSLSEIERLEDAQDVPDNSMNAYSIGIEFVGTEREGPSEEQIEEGTKLVEAIQKKYNIPNDKIISHKEWAPYRKKDGVKILNAIIKKLNEEPTTEKPDGERPTASSNAIEIKCIKEVGRKNAEICGFETKGNEKVTFLVSLVDDEVKIEMKRDGEEYKTETIKERYTGHFSGLKDSDGEYSLNFKVEDIKDDGTVGLLITKVYSGSSEGRKPYQRGKLTHRFTGLDGLRYNVVFEKSRSDRKAYVTVFSGREDVRGVSNFYIRIPIEKRPFNLTNEQIDSYLEKTNNTIEMLNGIISKMDKVLKTWRTICVSTHFFIVAKNLLFGGKSGARQAIMEGYSGRGGWKDYCLGNNGVGKKYRTYDECVFDNENEINSQIKSFDKEMKTYNRELKKGKGDITQTRFYKDLKEKDEYSYLKNAEENGQVDLVLGDFSMAQLVYYETMAEKSTNEDTGFVKKRDELKETLKGRVDSYKKAMDALETCDGCGDTDEKRKVALEAGFAYYDTLKARSKIEGQTVKFEDIQDKVKNLQLESGGKIGDVKEISIATVSRAKGSAYYFNPEGTEARQVELIPVRNKDIKKDGLADTLKGIFDYSLSAVTFSLERYEEEKEATFQIGGWYLYKEAGDNKKYYLVLDERNKDLKKEYGFDEDATAEFYSDGKPFCIPYPSAISDGTDLYNSGVFVKVLSYHDDGRPEDIQMWNVGSDGLLCTDDDIIILHDSLLNPLRREYAAQYHRVVSYLANKKCGPGGRIAIPGKGSFKCSTSAFSRVVGSSAAHCTDVMSTGDCKLMFNVCDPVMCPRSRFNLGGKWYVDDVVQSGMVGSLVLGLGNWGSEGQVVPPICFTGISASLKNIKSIFEGAQQCLLTAKEKGQSVGICDKIRNLFVCEVVWREGVSALSVLGGLLGGRNMGGEGGGEYLNFKSNFDNAGQSLNYFVTEYATTSNKAYRSRSLVEFGTEVCKSAIHSKFPGIGDIVQQFARPSDPAQFNAFMTIVPYSETAEASTYSVFYQIYAGTNENPYTGYPGVTYSVYMLSDNGDVYHVTDGLCNRVSRANIPAGGQVTKNVDCVAPKGFNQLCVDIDGRRECGFGRVSSSFSINWLNDQSVKREVNKKIDSEEECVPDKKSSLGDVITGTGTGVVRVCSVNPPGGDNWRPIGTCGVDDNKRNLGTCWVDEQTIDIKHLGDAKNVSDMLNENWDSYRLEQQAKMMGVRVEELMSKKESEKDLKAALSSGVPSEKLSKLKEFLRTSISPEHSAKALYEIARIYLEKAKTLFEERLVKNLTESGDGGESEDEAGEEEDGEEDSEETSEDSSEEDKEDSEEETPPLTFDEGVRKEISNLANFEERDSSISNLIELSNHYEVSVGYHLITAFEQSQKEESDLREGILMVLEKTAPSIKDPRLKRSTVSLLGIIVNQGKSPWDNDYFFEADTSILAAKVLGKIGDSDSKKHLKNALLIRTNDELFKELVSALRNTGAQGFFKLKYNRDEVSSGGSPLLRIYNLGFANSPDSRKDQAYTYLDSQNEFGMYIWYLDEVKWIIFDSKGFFVNDISDLAVYMRDYYSTSTLKGDAGDSRFVRRVSQLVQGVDSNKLWNLVNSEYFYDLVKYASEKGIAIGAIY